MKQYNVVCPVCGHVNRGLYLWETQGWMECDRCGAAGQLAALDEERSKDGSPVIRGPWCLVPKLA